MIIKEKITMTFIFPDCAEDFCNSAAFFAKELGLELTRANECVSFVVEYDNKVPEARKKAMMDKIRMTEAMFWYELGWNDP